jgi:hypothetical protein
MRFSCLLLTCAALLACSPALDWREVSLSDRSRLLFPCKPERLTRSVALAGQTLPAQMLVCDAQDSTWSATEFKLDDAALAPQALTQLRHLLSLNLGAEESALVEAMPAAQTVGTHWHGSVLRGRRPGGTAVTAHAVFFAQGRYLYQLVILTPDVHNATFDAAAEQFFDGPRWLNAAQLSGQP